MHINVHCALGIILSMIFLDYLNLFQIALIITVSILIDFDFVFSKYAKDHNHRRLPTHSFIPFLIFLPFGLVFIEFLWVGIVGIFHVILDLVDWGIYPLTPRVKDKIIGGFLFVPEVKEGDEPLNKCYFINTYYGSKIIIVLEIIAFLGAILLIIWRNLFYLILLVPYFLFLALHLITYFKYCKNKK